MPNQKKKKTPIDVLCIYRVKKGQEAAFKKLLGKHGPALKKAGLSAGTPKLWKAEAHRQPGTVFIEQMQWADAQSSNNAHQMPEVMAVWEPMDNLCESMEFLDLEALG